MKLQRNDILIETLFVYLCRDCFTCDTLYLMITYISKHFIQISTSILNNTILIYTYLYQIFFCENEIGLKNILMLFYLLQRPDTIIIFWKYLKDNATTVVHNFWVRNWSLHTIMSLCQIFAWWTATNFCLPWYVCCIIFPKLYDELVLTHMHKF